MTYKATYRDVKQIVLTQMPLTTYDLNESLDVSDGRIRVDFADGTSKEVSMTTDMVEGFSSKKTGTKTLKVTYAGCTLNYEIRVSDELTKKQENMQQRAAAIIKLYDGKTDLNDEALQELEQRAASMGAHAVVGVDMDYEVLGQGNMLMVTASGTAVTLEQA